MKKIAIIAIMVWEFFCIFSILIGRSTNDNTAEGVFIFLAALPFILYFVLKKSKQKGHNSPPLADPVQIRSKAIVPEQFVTMQIENYNRQFNESYDLITTSKNVETVLSRLQFIDKLYIDLKRTSGANKSWSYYQKLYETINSDREKIISDAIKRDYESKLLKALELTTESGRLNHIKKHTDKVMSLNDLPDSCKVYAKALFNNIEQDIKNAEQQKNKSYRYTEEQWRELSDKNYEEHLKNIEKFDPYNVDKSIITDSFTNAELNFLTYIHGKPVSSPDIAQYWNYEFKVDYIETMSKFFNCGYLRVTTAEETLPKLKVPDLKKILKEYSLPVSGKKDELIERIKNNISKSELENSVPKSSRFYCMTAEGSKQASKATPLREPRIYSYEDDCKAAKDHLAGLKILGTEKYEFLATLDDETCPICGALDKKVFKLSSAQIGKNCPPMHYGCRCTIAPYFEDSEEIFGVTERAARDPKTGKTIYVPDISYTEWKKYTDNN